MSNDYGSQFLDFHANDLLCTQWKKRKVCVWISEFRSEVIAHKIIYIFSE